MADSGDNAPCRGFRYKLLAFVADVTYCVILLISVSAWLAFIAHVGWNVIRRILQ